MITYLYQADSKYFISVFLTPLSSEKYFSKFVSQIGKLRLSGWIWYKIDKKKSNVRLNSNSWHIIKEAMIQIPLEDWRHCYGHVLIKFPNGIALNLYENLKNLEIFDQPGEQTVLAGDITFRVKNYLHTFFPCFQHFWKSGVS